MDPARWQEIEEIFHHASQLSAAQRQDYLAKACADSPPVRDEVQSLLTSLESEADFLQEPAFTAGLRLLGDAEPGLETGQAVGPYQILSRLGRGGMAEVYLAYDSRLGRKVALKVLTAGRFQDPELVSRFRHEAHAASNISHPNVAHIYEVGRAADRDYIAMEFVDGITLRERLQRGRLSIDSALQIAGQIGAAIAAAHFAGIIHRDIKPENVMLRQDGYVKVLDFGLAKLTESRLGVLDVGISNLTEPGILMGTATYMSPEQARGLSVDLRTDIWSWGVVLYEMLLGRPPFQGATASDVMAEILRATTPALERDARPFPPGLRRFLLSVLSKDREDRFADMPEAVSRLRELRGELVPECDLSLPLSEEPTSARGPGQAAAELTASHVVVDGMPTIPTRKAEPTDRLSFLAAFPRTLWAYPAWAFVVGAITVAAVGLFLLRAYRSPKLTITSAESVELPVGGNVRDAVISPDGKLVAWVADEAGKQSIHLRATDSSKDSQIVAPADSDYRGLTFSPQGESIYFVKQESGRGVLYRMPTRGGEATRITENLNTPVTFSPDGARMAFVRSSNALITANADGTGEKELARLNQPQAFAITARSFIGPAWSPDGQTIAAATTTSDSSNPGMDLISTNVADGSMTVINRRKWKFIGRIVWLNDGSGLIVDGRNETASVDQLWFLSQETGEAKRINDDTAAYFGASAANATDTMLVIKRGRDSSVWIQSGAPRRTAQVDFSQVRSSNYIGLSGIVWSAEGKLIFVNNEVGHSSIWTMNADGSERKPLTVDRQVGSLPATSLEGSHIVFVSTGEGGHPHLWRMEKDGSHPMQLTSGGSEDTPTLSPDGQWVFYHGTPGIDTIYRMSIDGGEPIALSRQPAVFPDVSPDGKLIACLLREHASDSTWKLGVVGSDDGQIVRTFDLPVSLPPNWPGPRWSADGRSVAYVVTVGGVSNIWTQDLSGGQPKQLTDFHENQIFSFDWSRTTNQIVCVRGAITKELFLIHGLGQRIKDSD